jgi:hexokinase
LLFLSSEHTKKARIQKIQKKKKKKIKYQIQNISSSNSSGLDAISNLFRDVFQISTTLEERLLVQTISSAISLRAARLSAAGIVAILRKIERTKEAKGFVFNFSYRFGKAFFICFVFCFVFVLVAIDGSVFEHIPGFKENMLKTIKELEPESSVELTLTKDGSGVGGNEKNKNLVII